LLGGLTAVVFDDDNDASAVDDVLEDTGSIKVIAGSLRVHVEA
jgi:hypothetical protein